MKRSNRTNKNSVLLQLMLFAIGFLYSGIQVYGQRIERFPYEVSLTNGKPREIVTHATQFTPIFNAKGVTLTNGKTQFSGIAIDHLQFKSNNGLTIEFEYLMYGGQQFEGKYGDGISFFLYDGSKTFSIGANGASMGYAYNRSTVGRNVRPGLDGAYLGIGIDNYGNFKNRMWTTTGDRMNGIVSTSPINPTYPMSHITIRGAMHNEGLAGYGNRGLRYSGYPVLFTTSTIGGRSVKINSEGKYELVNSTANTSFYVRPAGESTQVGDANYRKVIVKLVPGQYGNMIVTVQIQHGNTVSTIVDQYTYPQYLMYYENVNSTGANSANETQNMGPEQLVLLGSMVPETFKIGFAASTGAASQVQVIRNIKVSLPFFPQTKEFLLEGCSTTRAFTFNPFENNVFYKGKIGQNTTPVSGNDASFIDFSTFRFEDQEGNAISTATRYEQAGVGVWEFNTTTGYVTLKPEPGYLGKATIYYSVKGVGTDGGPFDQEIYRSGVTKIEINIQKCNAKKARINPFLSR